MKRFFLYLIIVLFICCLISFYCEAENLKVHFIDVGEGDSILVETPKAKTVLIDAGNLISGFKVVEYLKKNDIRNLDYLIFTHPHLDHIGGAFFILPMMNVKRIYDNGEDLAELVKTCDIYRWYEELVRRNQNYNVLKAEDYFLLDDVAFKILWPYRPFIFSDFNANSLVIMIEYKKNKCLLTADLTIASERELLKSLINLKVDILKVAHHGNYDANSREFLEAVSPKISVISVDKNNVRGYPSNEVLERLKALGGKVYRTDINGDIIVDIKDDGQITVNSDR